MKKEYQSKTDPLLIRDLITEFQHVSPAYTRWYGNKTYRSALDNLVVLYGFEEVMNRIKLLPKLNSIPFIPTVKNPFDFEAKWIMLETALERHQNTQTTKGRGVA